MGIPLKNHRQVILQGGSMRGFQPAQAKARANNYASGGPVRGPGTGTSDSVKDVVPDGTYIMPTDSTKAFGAKALGEMGQRGIPVNLSNGEFKLPPEQVHAIGVQALDQMKNATHTPVAARGFAPGAQQARQLAEPELFFNKGGVATEEALKRKQEAVQGAPGVVRNDNAYSDAPAVPAAPAARAQDKPNFFPGNSPDAGASIYAGAGPANGLGSSGKLATGAENVIAAQPPKPVAQAPAQAAKNPNRDALIAQIPASRGMQAFAQPVQQPTAVAPQRPAQPTPGAASPSNLFMQDRSAEMGQQLQAGNYAGAAGNAVRTAGQGLGMYALEAAEKISSPVLSATGRFFGGLTGMDTPAGAIAAPEPAAGKPDAAKPGAAPDSRNPYADANEAKLAEFIASEKSRVQAGGEPAYDPSGARPDLGYGPIGDRTKLTNEQAAIMNPVGRITATRSANGTMEFSGNDVRGQVSYNDADGKALPGGGLRGKGFSNFGVAPAGADVVMGPGGYAFATSGSGLRGGAGGAGDSQFASGGKYAGMTGAQAAQYQREVDAAQANAQSNARGNEIIRAMSRGGGDMRSPEWLAQRNASVRSSMDGNSRAGRARQRLEFDRENAQMQQATAMRGQDIQADASRYGYDTGAESSRYRSDQENARSRDRNALDSRRLAADEGRYGLEATAKGFDIRQAERMEGMQNKYLAAIGAGDEKAVGSLERQIRGFSGKGGDQANRFTTVSGGQEWDQQAGVMRNVPGRVLNNQTGQFIDHEQAKPLAPLAQSPQAIAIRGNQSMSREQKVEALRKLGYQG